MVLNNSHDPNELDLISSPVSVASQFGPSLHPRCIWVPFCLCGGKFWIRHFGVTYLVCYALRVVLLGYLGPG